ncbi:MAG: hypothetical protein JXA89_07090, partial [Anaerolineae bacterium]|nr:hypothetical protein [Anaerolineae bacterium]
KTGRTAVVASPFPVVRLVDWGDAGGHLGFLGGMDVDPMGSAERVGYVVLCESMEKAKHYTWLKECVDY